MCVSCAYTMTNRADPAETDGAQMQDGAVTGDEPTPIDEPVPTGSSQPGCLAHASTLVVVWAE